MVITKALSTTSLILMTLFITTTVVTHGQTNISPSTKNEAETDISNLSSLTMNYSRSFLSIFDDIENRIEEVVASTKVKSTELLDNHKIMSAEAAHKLRKDVQKVLNDATTTIEQEFFPKFFGFFAASMVAISTYAYIA